jgi:Xaa-Pro aminopeptidase
MFPAYTVVPSEDAHQSEYVCAADKRRGFISGISPATKANEGFTGSAGTAVITTDKAALFTDGRYFNQASKELDENWQLMKVGLIKVPTWQEWVAEQSQDGKTIGVDPAVITIDAARELKKKLKSAGKGKLIGVDENLVDKVWDSSRPARPENPVFVLPDKFTGIAFLSLIQENPFTIRYPRYARN